MLPQKLKVHKTHLYALRRIRGFRQKQLACLIGHRTAAMVSCYEAGIVLPSLETALMLEIVLGARLPEIYIDLYKSL